MAIGWVALLLLYASPGGFQGQGTHATETSAAHADCAARWDTHLANNRRQATVVWVGSLLQLCSAATFIYCARCLMRRPSAFASEAARELTIYVSSRVTRTCSMLGKLFVRPVIPWVLLSHAVFTYRCIGHYQGPLTGLLASLLSLVYVFLLILMDHFSPSSA